MDDTGMFNRINYLNNNGFDLFGRLKHNLGVYENLLTKMITDKKPLNDDACYHVTMDYMDAIFRIILLNRDDVSPDFHKYDLMGVNKKIRDIIEDIAMIDDENNGNLTLFMYNFIDDTPQSIIKYIKPLEDAIDFTVKDVNDNSTHYEASNPFNKDTGDDSDE